MAFTIDNTPTLWYHVSMMNKTETKAYEWLIIQGYHDITFRQRETPDFSTQEGKLFEVKKSRNNAIWFSKGQRQKLVNLNDNVFVLIYNDNPSPIEIVPFSTLNTGKLYWKNYKILFQEDFMSQNNLRDMPMITIHVNPADKEALKNKADSKGMQLATYCRMELLRLLEVNNEHN